jgi:hypothetical protein
VTAGAWERDGIVRPYGVSPWDIVVSDGRPLPRRSSDPGSHLGSTVVRHFGAESFSQQEK